jgi:hypothetical protein
MGNDDTAVSYTIFDHFRGNLCFQAQVSRMKDLANSERREILTMLCGPESILTTWEPAPETCELYRREVLVTRG